MKRRRGNFSMEKNEHQQVSAEKKTPSWSLASQFSIRILSKLVLIALTVTTLCRFVVTFSSFSLFGPAASLKLTIRWSWSSIIPSRELVWSSCYHEFQCARLDVPLDWLDPSEDKRVMIAIIKLPATDLENYKGPVFTNPGGPGDSGIHFMGKHGKGLQKIIGRNYDLISFDPRGLGETTPLVNCWSSQKISQIWAQKDLGVVDSHPGVLYDSFARSSALSANCIQNSPEIVNFVSTTSVARDMLEILDKTGWKKLRYWGFSYGTMLGGMFAAVYPDRVDRLISDGNVDYKEWTTCSHLSALHDADKVMDAFYEFCHKAGPEACRFYFSTPAAIEKRLIDLQENLKIHPIIVPGSAHTADFPEIITYSRLRRLINMVLYRPVYSFPTFAKILLALEKRDGPAALALLERMGLWAPFSDGCEAPGIPDNPSLEDSLVASDDAFRAIMCTDGGGMNETVEEFEGYVNHLIRESKATGATTTSFRMACAGWTVRAKWAFKGPFTGNTSYPILYLANKADNVTPYRSALENSRGFQNSVILIQDSYGHMTLSAPSICTARHIRAYFQEGNIPPTETHCPADVQPFEHIQTPPDLQGKDLELWSGLMDIARAQQLDDAS